MQWIKEVELVDSVDELRSSSSIRGISMPNFEVLDARIALALNKIIHNSQFKRRISLEEQKAQKQDRFLRGRQIAYNVRSIRDAKLEADLVMIIILIIFLSFAQHVILIVAFMAIS